MAKRGRPRNPPGGVITPRMQAYLAALPAAGGAVAVACQAVTLRANTLTKWRGRSEAFRAEEVRVRDEIAHERGEVSRLRAYAKNALLTRSDAVGVGEDLEKWQRVFLLVFREHRDTMKACKAAEKRWATVKTALAEDADFRAAMDEMEEELEIQLRDAQRRRAIETGDPAAANAIRKADAEKASRKKTGPIASRKERVERLKVEKGAVN